MNLQYRIVSCHPDSRLHKCGRILYRIVNTVIRPRGQHILVHAHFVILTAAYT